MSNLVYNAVVFVFIPQASVKELQIPRNSTTWLIAGLKLAAVRDISNSANHTLCVCSIQALAGQ